jgi:hypothetical protein
MSERWKAVPGYPGYEVSTLGRVKSLAHVQVRKGPTSGRVQWFNYAERILRPRTNPNGYLMVNLNGDQLSVHRVVLMTFDGACPQGHQACHNNGQRDDNRLNNLRWDTTPANAKDRIRHGTQTMGETHPTAKYSDAVAAAIRSGAIGSGEARDK